MDKNANYYNKKSSSVLKVLKCKNKILFSYKFLIVLLIVLIFSIVFIAKGKFFSRLDSKLATIKTGKVSIQSYMQIQMGMTYNQIKAILGDGVQNISVDKYGIKSSIYLWKNNKGGSISIAFQKNKVINKAQVLLEKINSKVTMKDYNKLSIGMTYNQVKGILGEGQLISESEYISNDKSDVYSWVNRDGTYISIVFVNDILSSKVQFNLK